MCRRHWSLVPIELQRRIWRLFRPGQEQDKQASSAYMEAATQAVHAVAAAERAGRRRRALTLWPEWAWAISHLGKNRENRSWAPPDDMIGDWLAIHAGAYVGGRPGDSAVLEGLNDLRNTVECIAEEEGSGLSLPYYAELIPQITTGAVVAVCRVTGVERSVEPAGWYNGEPNVGWKLEQVRVLETPVRCKGAQGLWVLPHDVLVKVREQLHTDAAGRAGNASGEVVDPK